MEMISVSVQLSCMYFSDGPLLIFFTFSLLCCRWSFGDGGYKEFEYMPPYSHSLLCPDSPNQVLLSNSVTYIYSQPGNLISCTLSNLV